jgi:hypothetical protein
MKVSADAASGKQSSAIDDPERRLAGVDFHDFEDAIDGIYLVMPFALFISRNLVSIVFKNPAATMDSLHYGFRFKRYRRDNRRHSVEYELVANEDCLAETRAFAHSIPSWLC